MSFTCWECGAGMSNVDDRCEACGTLWDQDAQAIEQAKFLEVCEWRHEWEERFRAPPALREGRKA